jgi:RNA polymerase sigma factor (sigma-70 family)
VSPRLSDLLLSSQSDERLVSLARSGHERAFAVIVERYRPELQATARRLCRDGRSEDVVQQAFLSAFSALRSGAEVKHLRGWLYQIVRNAAGRPQAPPCVPLDRVTVSADTVEEIVQQRAMAKSALSEIARLPARQRQAMIGTAVDGLARADIAHTMGLSEGAVRQLVHRARATLRSAVTALTPWPLVRWIAAVGPDTPGTTGLAVGAGAASSGGFALKLGVLLASGTLLTGAAVHLQAPTSHRGDARAAVAGSADGHARGSLAQSRSRLGSQSVASPADGASMLASTSFAGVSVTRSTALHGGGHEGTSSGSGERSEGSPVDERGGRGDGTDRGGGGGNGTHGGGGGSPAASTGSEGHGQSGQASAGRGSGGDDGSGSGDGARGGTASGSGDGARSGTASGSGGEAGSGSGGGSRTGSGGGSGGADGGAAEMVSDTHPLDATVEGSDSSHGSGSGDGSSSGEGAVTGSGSGSGSGGGSASSGNSGSGGGSGSDDDGGTSGD